MTKLSGKNKAKARKKEQLQKRLSKERYIAQFKDMILTGDNPVLTAGADLVIDGEDLGFVLTMKKVLGTSKTGVGLAAPQIGVAKQVCVITDPKTKAQKVLINPVITKHKEEKMDGFEYCLSYPGAYAKVSRWLDITVKYLDENLKEKEEDFADMAARIVQHEIDHLQEGICEVGKVWMEKNKWQITEKQLTENVPDAVAVQ